MSENSKESDTDKPQDTEEGARKGDELLKRMLQTSPKPHRPKKWQSES